MRQGLLFSIIVSTIFCAPALAYDWSTNPGDGSAENPYQISTPEQLNAIGTDYRLWRQHFMLTSDIDMSVYNETQYNIVGTYAEPFSGTFDGNEHSISNLRITREGNSSFTGLFATIRASSPDSVIIKDLLFMNTSTVIP